MPLLRKSPKRYVFVVLLATMTAEQRGKLVYQTNKYQQVAVRTSKVKYCSQKSLSHSKDILLVYLTIYYIVCIL